TKQGYDAYPCGMHPFVEAAQRLESAARERLAAYVGHETPTGDRAALNDFAEVLAARYTELGATVERVEHSTGDHLVAHWAGGSESDHLLVLGHHDTVWPVGQLEEMPYVDDGEYIRGPGVFDMKGGLVAFETA